MWKDSTEININLNVSSINLKSPLLAFSWQVASHTETGNPLWAHWLREYLTFCRVSYPVALLAASCFFIELIRLKYQSSSNSDLQRDYYKIRAHTHLPLHTHLFRCCKWIWMCLLISLCPPPPPAAGPHGGYFYLVLKYPSAEANMEGDSRMTCYTTASSSSMSYAHCPVVSLQARYMSIKALHLRLCGHRFFFCVSTMPTRYRKRVSQGDLHSNPMSFTQNWSPQQRLNNWFWGHRGCLMQHDKCVVSTWSVLALGSCGCLKLALRVFAIFSSNIKHGTEKRSGQHLTRQILDISRRKFKTQSIKHVCY